MATRLPSLDAARVFATFGIVWTHTAEITGTSARVAALGRFGTSFYVIVAVLFSVLAAAEVKDRGQGESRGLEKRARRLLVPFLTWSLIYAAFYLGTMLPSGYSLAEITRFWGPLAGTAMHLWFLPFAFVVGTVAHRLSPRLLGLSTMKLTLLTTTVVLSSYVACYGLLAHGVDRAALTSLGLHRLDRWIEELPLATLAIGACVLGMRARGALLGIGKEKRLAIASAAFVGFLAVEGAYFQFLETLRPFFWTEVRPMAHLGGILLGIGFLALHDADWPKSVAPLGRSTYFAFLGHLLVLDLLKTPLSALSGYGTVPFALALSVAIFGATLGAGLLARRVRTLAFVVP